MSLEEFSLAHSPAASAKGVSDDAVKDALNGRKDRNDDG